jgi:hypothetical protein
MRHYKEKYLVSLHAVATHNPSEDVVLASLNTGVGNLPNLEVENMQSIMQKLSIDFVVLQLKVNDGTSNNNRCNIQED